MAKGKSAKKEALDVIEGLPARATWDDIMYEIYVRRKISIGEAAADHGDLIPHEEVKKRFLKPR